MALSQGLVLGQLEQRRFLASSIHHSWLTQFLIIRLIQILVQVKDKELVGGGPETLGTWNCPRGQGFLLPGTNYHSILN